MSKDKMKGLLKGLRYISQIFDNEKEEEEEEMQIGYPTDVKHVAHIGSNGPSVHSPSWMNEFKSPTGIASAPLIPGRGNDHKDNRSTHHVAEGMKDSVSRTTPSSPARDLPEIPRSTRRHSHTGGSVESPKKEKSGKPRHSSRHSSRNSSTKESLDTTKQSRPSSNKESGSESPSMIPLDVPKKSRRKKSKDSSTRGSLSGTKAQAVDGDGGSQSGSVSKSTKNCDKNNSEDNFPLEDS